MAKFLVTVPLVGYSYVTVEAENEEIALDYAYHAAFDYREGFAGLHGCVDYPEFCEEEGYDIDSDDAADAFHDMIENEIEYFTEVYDENNETHQWVLIDCNGKFWEV